MFGMRRSVARVQAKLAALAAVRGIGRREALKRLELIGPGQKPVARKGRKTRQKGARRRKAARRK